MITRTLTTLTLALMIATPVFATVDANTPSAATDQLKTDLEKTSYALGTVIGSQIGGMLKARQTEVDFKIFVIGITDSLMANKPALGQEQIKAVMTALEEKMKAKMEEEQKARAASGTEQLVAGKAYLEANAKKDGIKATPSGLQYKVLTEGTGDMPKATDKVKVHYRGTLTDGTEFDSSYKRGEPISFNLGGVIKGWTEGVQLMKVGAKYQFTIPSELGYGERGTPGIPPNSVLIFDVELLGIE